MYRWNYSTIGNEWIRVLYSDWFYIHFLIVSILFSLLFGSIIVGNKIKDILSKSIVFRILGQIAYPFYLFHWLVIFELSKLNGEGLVSNKSIVNIVVVYLLTIIGAYFFYNIIEVPLNKLIKRFSS